MATPIGNLRDITLRALDVLNAADVILCEDTRVTAKLLARHTISRPTMSYHDHNAARMVPRVIERLRAGGVVALVSDAGTPLVSDPGARLVAAAVEAGIAVIPVPGPSALLAALTVATLPTERFLFAGFPPPKAVARQNFLRDLAPVPATLVFFEAPHRLAASLADMARELGPRGAAVCREMTKKFEEVRRGALDVLARDYAAGGAVRGEIVVVVGPPDDPRPPSADEADAALRDAMARLSIRDAVAEVAELTGQPRRTLYARALELRREREAEAAT